MVAEFAAAIREGRPAGTDGTAGTAGAVGARGGRHQPPGPGCARRRRRDGAAAGAGPMTTLSGARVLVTGGAGTIGSTIVDQALEAGAAHVDVLDNLVRGRRANLDDALATGRATLVEGDIRDRDLVHDLTRGKDLVFHQAAIRITQCAEEPRLALEVLVDGSFNVVEAAVEAGIDKLVDASSASVYGLADEFPTTERHHHHNNDTLYGAAKSFNEGMVRSFRAMTGLDYVGLRLLQRLRPPDGRARRIHRGAGALDGADRGRPAAADLRRRPPDDGLRLRARHRARQHPRRDQRRRRRSLQHCQCRGDQPARARGGAPAGDGLRPGRRARSRAGRERRDAPAGRHRRSAPRPGLGADDRARGRA